MKKLNENCRDNHVLHFKILNQYVFFGYGGEDLLSEAESQSVAVSRQEVEDWRVLLASSELVFLSAGVLWWLRIGYG